MLKNLNGKCFFIVESLFYKNLERKIYKILNKKFYIFYYFTIQNTNGHPFSSNTLPGVDI